ncbi:MAG: hypothetical protein IPL61_00265 [Myxococcales bacterium]|nr:hypothetical protein [Myxococcales bacterium]
MTVRPSTVWRRVRWALAFVALCTLATCPAAIQRCSVEQTADEAPTLLRYLVGQIRAYVTEHGELPAIDVGPTPAIGTCCATRRVCAPDADLWLEPGWRALKFSIDGRHRFSYQVARAGKALVLTATGDQDCDQVRATITVTLTLDGGNLVEAWAQAGRATR